MSLSSFFVGFFFFFWSYNIIHIEWMPHFNLHEKAKRFQCLRFVCVISANLSLKYNNTVHKKKNGDWLRQSILICIEINIELKMAQFNHQLEMEQLEFYRCESEFTILRFTSRHSKWKFLLNFILSANKNHSTQRNFCLRKSNVQQYKTFVNESINLTPARWSLKWRTHFLP